MISVNIVRKYTKSLSDISVKNGKEKLHIENMKYVLEVFNNSENLRRCLNSSKITKTVKINILQDIFLDRIDKTILNFLIVLIKNERIYLLQNIYDDFENIIYKKINKIKMSIISEDKLSSDAIFKIEEKYKNMYNADEIVTDLSIDKSLIGGVKIVLGDKVIDDSIKYKLTKLQKILGGL